MNVLSAKNYIKEELLKKTELELQSAKEAHENTKQYTESDDLKQEGKYDTRAIEANYLKDAQAKRIHELNHELKMINNIQINLNDIAKFNYIQGSNIGINAVFGTFLIDCEKYRKLRLHLRKTNNRHCCFSRNLQHQHSRLQHVLHLLLSMYE